MKRFQPDAETLTFAEAWHLAWRTGYGAAVADLRALTELDLESAVARVVQTQPESARFVETEQLLRNVAIDTQSIDGLKAWWLFRIHQTANPLAEKMSVLWHNHFATSFAKVMSVRHMLSQNELIRRFATGDFRQLLHGMAEDVAMLIWLDGNANRKRHPNENFAREVMELFSLGVGNYTEDDIKEAARAFTGWHVRQDRFWFNQGQHDFGEKTVLGRTGPLQGHDIVDLCLEQESCPRFLAVKLLQTFVTHRPDAAETTELAATITRHQFQMSPVLTELLLSEVFWKHRQSYIKSPLEYLMGTYRALEVRPHYLNAGKLLAQLGHNLFEPPTVKGWEGGEQWINSTSLIQRLNFATRLTQSNDVGQLGDLSRITSDLRAFAQAPTADLLARFLLGTTPLPEVSAQLTSLFRDAAEGNTQLPSLVHGIMTLPEYQLI